jgi:hypothetical protein
MRRLVLAALPLLFAACYPTYTKMEPVPPPGNQPVTSEPMTTPTTPAPAIEPSYVPPPVTPAPPPPDVMP